jgi:glutaredoxin
VPPVALTLLSKPGCHLCDDARDVVAKVVGEVGEAGVDVTVDELSILDDAELRARYAEEIPVVLIDGKVHNIWRIDPTRLANALTEAAS